MAGAGISYVDDLSCSVCFERCTDPRSLKCGHQFCLSCLERVSVTMSVHKGCHVVCPTCMVVTKLPQSTGVVDLPRPGAVNPLEDILQQLTISRKGSQHEDTETKPSPGVSACQTHSIDICMYCRTCNTGVCKVCVIMNHRGHQVDNITPIADKIRVQVQDFVTRCRGDATSRDHLGVAQQKIDEIERQRDSVLRNLNESLGLLKTLRYRIKDAIVEVTQQASSDLQTMSDYRDDIESHIDKKTEVEQLGEDLMKASDEELISRSKELPSSLSTFVLPLPTVTMPQDIGLQFMNGTIQHLLDYTAHCMKKYTEGIPSHSPTELTRLPRIVNLTKGPGETFGFSLGRIASDSRGTQMFVVTVHPGSYADNYGGLRPGDLLLSVNGILLNCRETTVKLLKELSIAKFIVQYTAPLNPAEVDDK